MSGMNFRDLILAWTKYISKPFSPKILVARVNALLRRSNVLDADEHVEAGGIVVDKAAHQVQVDGKDVELSYKEFELLSYFLRIRELHFPGRRY